MTELLSDALRAQPALSPSATEPVPVSAHSGDDPSRVTITAAGAFTATHVCAEPAAHPHEWNVKAGFSVAPGTDARCYLAALDGMLASWDGKALPPDIQLNEEIAAAVGTLCNCIWVEVWREAERIGARWPR